MSQQELFSRLLTLAQREKDRLACWMPLTETEKTRLMRLPVKTKTIEEKNT